MDKNKINISNIETFLYNLLNGIIGDDTVVGSEMPSKVEIPSECKSICHIDIPNGVGDFDAYGRGTALISLYARPMDSGRKNVAILAEMEERLNEAIESSRDDTYKVVRRLTYSSYNRDIDWHCNVIELVVIVL